MIDSRIPRFAQAFQGVALAVAFLADAWVVVPLLGLALTASVVGGPRWNLFARLYGLLKLPPGEMEPAAPPRFAQTLGAVFLGIGTVGLVAAEPETAPWWVLGWGPALAVALLAALAATTSF